MDNDELHTGLLKKILHNAKWLALFALFGRASWLLSILLLAKTIGSAQFGEFSAYMAFWLISGRILGLGLEVWVNRNIAATRDKAFQRKLSVLATRTRLTLVVGGFLLLLATGRFLPSTIIIFYPMFILLAIRQAAESVREVQVAVLQGQERMKLQTMILVPWDFIQLFSIAALTQVFNVENSYLLILILAVISLGKTISLNFSIQYIFNHCKTELPIFSFEYARTAKESYFFGLGLLFALGLGKFDVLILRMFTSPVTVGNYSVAYIFLDASVIILGVVRQSLFPSLSRFSATAKSSFVRLAEVTSISFFASGIVGALLLYLVGPLLLELAGRSFSEAPPLVILLAIALPWVALSGSLGGAIVAGGLAKQSLIAQACGLSCNVIANLFWIPTYGAAGAACATLLAYAVTSCGYGYILHKFNLSK